MYSVALPIDLKHSVSQFELFICRNTFVLSEIRTTCHLHNLNSFLNKHSFKQFLFLK